MKLISSAFLSQKRFLAGVLTAILCEIIFGFSFFFTKKTVSVVSPMDLLSWRFLVASLIFGIGALTRLIRMDFRGKKVLPLFGIGLVFPCLYFLFEVRGVILTTSSETGIVIATAPVMSILLSMLFLHEKTAGFQCIGIACAVIGTILCAVSKGLDLSFSPLGYFMLLCGIVCYCFYGVLSMKLDPRLSSVERTCCIVVTAAVIYSSFVLIRHAFSGTLSSFLTLPFRNRDFLIAILYLGGCCSFLALFLCNFSIARIGAVRFASFIGVETVVSILAGVLILHESFSWMEAVGAVLVISGVYLTNSRRTSHHKNSES